MNLGSVKSVVFVSSSIVNIDLSFSSSDFIDLYRIVLFHFVLIGVSEILLRPEPEDKTNQCSNHYYNIVLNRFSLKSFFLHYAGSPHIILFRLAINKISGECWSHCVTYQADAFIAILGTSHCKPMI